MSSNNSTLESMFKLLQKAKNSAYAPYSNFSVGACILSENSIFHIGCNVENAAYPQGCCAEASAISAMIISGDKRIIEIGIMGSGDSLCTPCGGCRQKIREFADMNSLIHIFNDTSHQKTFTLAELLPYSFGPDNLT